MRVETGLMKLFLELVAGASLFWVRTSGYLDVPTAKRHDPDLMRFLLGSDSGLARFRPVLDRLGGLNAVEVTACIPHECLTTTQIQVLVRAVIESAVWQAPRFKALVNSLTEPPELPRGQDPSLGLLWSDARL